MSTEMRRTGAQRGAERERMLADDEAWWASETVKCVVRENGCR